MNKVKVVIPVKKKSDRVKDKNFRNFFNNKSLFDLLIEKLIKSHFVEDIYISSNNKEIEKKVTKLGCTFVYREEKYCNNIIPWSDMIYHTVNSLPIKANDHLAWCHTTTPLFDNYDQAIRKYFNDRKKYKNDGLVVVSPFNEFIVSEMKKPVNYSWGPWHKYSQDLDLIRTMYLSPQPRDLRVRLRSRVGVSVLRFRQRVALPPPPRRLGLGLALRSFALLLLLRRSIEQIK